MRELNPNTGRKKSPFSFADVLRHQQVAAFDDIVLKFLEGRSFVAFPKLLVGILAFNANGGIEYLLNVFFGNFVALVLKHHKQIVSDTDVVFGLLGVSVVHKKVGQVEIVIENIDFLELIPVYVNDGFYGFEPTQVDGNKIIFIDFYFARTAGLGNVVFNKNLEFFFVFLVVKGVRVFRECCLDSVLNQQKLPRLVVARRDVPVEIVLIKQVLHVAVGHKSNFFKIESTQKSGRQGFIERPRLANGQDQLHKHGGHVKVSRFGLGPQQRYSAREAGLFRKNGKVNISNNFGRIKLPEPVGPHLVFQFFLSNVFVLHFLFYYLRLTAFGY